MNRSAAVMLAVFAAGAPALAQEPRINCASTMTAEDYAAYDDLIESGIYDPPTIAFRGAFEIPVTFHVVRRSNGTGGATPQQITQALADLNDAFAPASMSFCKMGTTLYIDSDAFYFDIDTLDEINALRSMNHVPSTVNVYCTENLAYEDFELCGISSFTTQGVQGIVMWNGCFGVTDDLSFAHEVGHYFNLPHTHETACCGLLCDPCAECTDGGNCQCCGDRICDTPADPGLYDPYNDIHYVDNDCDYIGNIALPAGCNGPAYDPDTANIMSYTRKHCYDSFTNSQNTRMQQTLTNLRPELIDADCADADDCGAGSGPCPDPHGGTGCLDAACCSITCDVDPTCCSTEWDQACADLASNLCGLEPPSDDCADAILFAGSYKAFSTVYADTDGPSHAECGGQIQNDVWFRYVSPCTGYLRFSTCDDATFDTRLAVYQANACPPNFIDLLGCNDDGPGCGNGSSEITVFVQQDDDLRIRVGGAGDVEGEGVLRVQCTSLWDDCDEPLVLFDFQGSIFLENEYASTDGPLFCGAQKDVWVDYYAPCTGLLEVSVCNAANFDTRLCIYDTCACPVTMNDLISNGNCAASAFVEANQCYKVRLGGADGDSGSAQMTFTCTPGPVNDDCADASDIEPGDVLDYDLDIAMTDGPPHDPPCTTGQFDCSGGLDLTIERDIWYRFVAPCDAELTVSTCNLADFDTRLVVYDSCDCPVTDQDMIACNDDAGGCGNGTSEVTVDVSDGQCYLIRLGVPLCAIDYGMGQISVEIDPDCQGDMNGDGIINVTDLLMLLAAWGPCPPPPLPCPGDFDRDGQVGINDLLIQLANWT